jgi:thiol-disulfide isomerase/thioredoxin
VRTRFLLLVIGLLFVLVGELHLLMKPQPNDREIQKFSEVYRNRSQWQGRLAPDFDLETTTGPRFRLSENIGKKVIVLNFFATWCGPCRDETPELNRYYQKHRSEDFLLLGVDGGETRDLVDKFAGEFKLSYPLGIDHGSVRKSYGVGAYPTTVLIGVDGKVQFYEGGELPNADVAFDSFLRLNRQILASGRGISSEAYLKQVGVRPQEPAPPPATALDARAQRIVARMDCPCGCDKRLADCTCRTGQKIRATLAAGGFGNQSDVGIMAALNKKFCMGGM